MFSNLKFLRFLDNSLGILGIFSVPGQHVKFDYTDSCVFRHLLFGGRAVSALQETQTDWPTLSLPHRQLGWICTGAQTQYSVKCNCTVYFPSCVFVQKKYANVYACTAAEKVRMPFPAVLMQGLLLHKWRFFAKSHFDMFLMPGT